MNSGWLSVIGLAAVIVCGAWAVILVWLGVKGLLQYIYRQIKIKTRFNKKPTAKCYCRDCAKWNPDNGKCSDEFNLRHMGPGWFCCFAEPLTGKRFIERDKLEVTEDGQEARG